MSLLVSQNQLTPTALGSEQIAPGPAPVGAKDRIAPGPSPAAKPAGAAKSPKPPLPEHKDGTREIVETIVFVVVLVLLLKTFVAEAFIIPTGSMATTLLGYHKDCTCDRCGYGFRVNASSEVDPDEGDVRPVNSGICPNCRHVNGLAVPGKREGP